VSAGFQEREEAEASYDLWFNDPGVVGGDVVRIGANASKRAVTGGVAAITFGWSVNIALRNLR